MTRYYNFGVFVQMVAFVFAESNINFLQDIVFYDFYPTCNIIICKENEGINLIKMLSPRFQRFVAVQSADKALMPFSLEPRSFILDLQCPNARTILRQADDLILFSKPFQWILLGEGVTAGSDSNTGNSSENWESSEFWPFFETLNIRIDSDVKVLEKSSDEKITVMGVYKVNDIFIKEPLAEWNSKKKFTVLNPKPVPTRRWNLHGQVIPSATVFSDPKSLHHLDDLVDKHIDTTSKVSGCVIKLLESLLNSSIYLIRDTEWGELVNGSWTGIVGRLERKEIELGGTPLFFRKNRMKIAEYFSPVTSSRSKFLFVSPPLSYSGNIFAMPFDPIVWSCCFTLVTLSCFFLFASLSYEKAKRGDEKVSFSEILVVNIGAICLQGTFIETKNPPSRVLTLFLYLSYMFLYISYSASIVAILQSSDTSIQTLADFLRSPLRAGAEDVIYSQEYFRKADGEIRRAIYRKKIAPKGERPHFLSIQEGIKEVRKGFYGYHVELSSGYSFGYQEIQKTFTEDEKCGLQELKESYYQFPEPYIVMKKRTPYAEHFKIGLKMCIERGFKSRFIRRLYTEKPICASKASRFVSVGIFDCYYAFMLLSAGVIASFLVMLLEITIHGYVKKREKKELVSNKDYIAGLEFFN